jgi:hypothetical protein
MAVIAATRLRLAWDATSIVWIVAPLLVGVALLFVRRRAGGKSQGSVAPAGACVALFGAQAALALAGNPRTFAWAWEIHWGFVWGASLALGSSEGWAVIRRVLVAGALLDAGMLIGSFASPAVYGWTSENASLSGWLALSGALRIGLLPIGATALWEKARRLELWSFVCLAVIPSSAVLFSRLGQVLANDNNVRPLLVNVIFLACFPAAVIALATSVGRRREAWMISTVTGAVAAISISMPGISYFPWLILFGATAFRLGQVMLDTRLDPEIVSVSQPTRSMQVAAEEWRVPRLWRLAIEMPLRGLAHVSRFLDGLVFDQFPRRLGARLVNRFQPALDRIPEAIRDRFWRHVALALLVFVLMQAIQ